MSTKKLEAITSSFLSNNYACYYLLLIIPLVNNPLYDRYILDFSIQLKYIFPAGGLLKSTSNTFVKKRVKRSEIEKSPMCPAMAM